LPSTTICDTSPIASWTESAGTVNEAKPSDTVSQGAGAAAAGSAPAKAVVAAAVAVTSTPASRCAPGQRAGIR